MTDNFHTTDSFGLYNHASMNVSNWVRVTTINASYAMTVFFDPGGLPHSPPGSPLHTHAFSLHTNIQHLQKVHEGENEKKSKYPNQVHQII